MVVERLEAVRSERLTEGDQLIETVNAILTVSLALCHQVVLLLRVSGIVDETETL